jgi:hypothetical protein
MSQTDGSQHGIKRSRLTPQAAETKRLKELSKIEAYTALQDSVLANVQLCASLN